MLNRFSLFILLMLLTIFSCTQEIDCNSRPSIPNIDREELENDIAEIEAYLEAEGIPYQTDESGLRYTVIEQGVGNNPNFCGGFTIDFEGRVLGEDEAFSAAIGSQLVMQNNQLVPGFKIAVSLMNRGADYKFYFPAALMRARGISNPQPANIPDGEIIEYRIRLTNY